MDKEIITKEILYDLYWVKELSIKKIAEILNYSSNKIFNFMKSNNIKRRDKTYKIKKIWELESHREKMSKCKMGDKNPFYGKKHSKKTIENLSAKKKEWHKNNPEYISGKNHHFYGKKLSKEHRDKISKNSKNMSGKNNPMYGRCGPKNPNWKPPHERITPLYEAIRSSTKYKLWRKSIFERDEYKCQFCGSIEGGTFQADHIVPFSYIIKSNNIKSIEDANSCEKLWEVDNGRTLCITCHKNTDTYGKKAKTYTKEK